MYIDKDELNIYEVESIYQTLLKELNNDSIVIDMTKVNKIDMSVIQLFISAKITFQEHSKFFKLENVNKEVSDILKSCACDFLLGIDDE